jgi:antitoxin component of MazEF toxin-antitoxin module
MMTSMPIFRVRRSGNSLVLVLPSELARSMKLHEGDKVLATIEKVPNIMEFAGKLKGIITADEFTRLTNEGEDLG